MRTFCTILGITLICGSVSATSQVGNPRSPEPLPTPPGAQKPVEPTSPRPGEPRTLPSPGNPPGTQTPGTPPTTRISASSTPAQEFLSKVAAGGMAEVELGKIASTKASDPKVKAFAQRMVNDHSKANETVKALATKKSVTVPTAPSAEHNAANDKLAALSGSAFDRAYVQAMVEDHRKAVAEFKAQASNGADPEVKAFAAKTLPTLEDHLRAIEMLDKELGTR